MGWEPNRMDEVFAGPSYPHQSTLATQVDHHRADHHRSPCPQWSISSSSSPNPMVDSMANISLSCVTLETSQDDCSYTRFVAWVAIKRNSSRLMSSSEKRQCPLLQCRKQFPDHERMLKHLPSCPHLLTREYWCYSCMRVEHFDDVKCKRCISHPSRRRKMLTMAKSFFSTLGNKPRRGPDSVSDVVDEPVFATADYYQSQPINFDSPTQPELSSTTEILEIDSTEIEACSISASDPPLPVVDPQALLVPELDSVPMQSSMQWQPTPFTQPLSSHIYAAAAEYTTLSIANMPPRVASHATQQTQPTPRSVPAATRSKNLSPSSSVRSTTSMMSNVSNVSSISASSLWSVPSTAWSGMETNFTSASADPISPLDVLQGDPFNTIQEKYPLDTIDILSELPADTPELHELPSGDFDLHGSLFPFEANITAANASYPADFSVEEEIHDTFSVQPPETEDSAIFRSETKSLVASAWDALQEHILASLSSIQHIENPLAYQLSLLSAQTIAHKGLASLRGALEGRPSTSPLDTLCLIHVIYSFSLVVYGDDAARRSSVFFVQSLMYAAWFTTEDDQAQFREIAKAIWQPSHLSDLELSQLMRTQSTPMHTSLSTKGKGLAAKGDRNIVEVDPLLSAARDFLDELETAAVFGSSADLQQVPGLLAKHTQDESLKINTDIPATMNVGGLINVLNVLINRFHDVNGLIAQLSQVNQSIKKGLLRSTRRFELEALQAGQRCIVPSKYFDNYVPLLRSLCDPIYEIDGASGSSQRQEYYSLGISMSEALMTELRATPVDFDVVSPVESDHDVLLDILTPPLTNDPMDLDPEKKPLVGLGLQDIVFQNGSIDHITSVSTPSIENVVMGATDLRRSASSSSHEGTQTASSPSSSSPAQPPKVEANACCDLCGYRPKGDPRWFHGSMQKHKKLQHSTEPPKIYKCPYPDCNSAYKNRPDNLRQHQIEKNHFVEGEEEATRRPSKRKKVAS